MRATEVFAVCLEVYRLGREILEGKLPTLSPERPIEYLWKPDVRARLAEYVADFALLGERALRPPRLASRLILFRVYYLGGAPYDAARKYLGISELTWCQWDDEVRHRCGQAFEQAGLYPPKEYFRDFPRVKP